MENMQSITEPRIESKFQTNTLGFGKFSDVIRGFGFLKSFPPRIITSLYYDDVKFTSVNDNLAGITPRSKYRLRWYRNSENKEYGLRFEKKIKRGILGVKRIIEMDNITSEVFQNTSIENLRRISGIKDPTLLPLNYFPQLLCKYNRSYYENYQRVRLTIDTNIKFYSIKNSNDLLYNKKIPVTSNCTILEIKFMDTQKISIQSFLNSLPSPSLRCSKYLFGQSKLQGFSYL